MTVFARVRMRAILTETQLCYAHICLSLHLLKLACTIAVAYRWFFCFRTFHLLSIYARRERVFLFTSLFICEFVSQFVCLFVCARTAFSVRIKRYVNYWYLTISCILCYHFMYGIFIYSKTFGTYLLKNQVVVDDDIDNTNSNSPIISNKNACTDEVRQQSGRRWYTFSASSDKNYNLAKMTTNVLISSLFHITHTLFLCLDVTDGFCQQVLFMPSSEK